jgi:hypothetical protein
LIVGPRLRGRARAGIFGAVAGCESRLVAGASVLTPDDHVLPAVATSGSCRAALQWPRSARLGRFASTFGNASTAVRLVKPERDLTGLPDRRSCGWFLTRHFDLLYAARWLENNRDESCVCYSLDRFLER